MTHYSSFHNVSSLISHLSTDFFMTTRSMSSKTTGMSYISPDFYLSARPPVSLSFYHYLSYFKQTKKQSQRHVCKDYKPH